jgi:hypothetical protein
VRLYKQVGTYLIAALVLAAALFLATSIIDRHGPAVEGWQILGEAPYRHARGVPFIYLERSLPDGVCEPQAQDPGCKSQEHQLNTLYLVTDMGFWLFISGLIVASVCKVARLPHKA